MDDILTALRNLVIVIRDKQDTLEDETSEIARATQTRHALNAQLASVEQHLLALARV